MPELPEVETTRRGIEPHIINCQVTNVAVHQPQLRWPVTEDIGAYLSEQRISGISRRGKYLLFEIGKGHLLIHLGMSGSLRLVDKDVVRQKHDHVDIELSSGKILRYTDPRRFGAILWISGAPQLHALLKNLGPEPLTDEFSGDYLYQRSRGRKLPLKSFIMDSKVVVGVGNIYANEALFLAGIKPARQAGSISRKRYAKLAESIRQILANAIEQGGTSLRDFVGGDGKPGYFKQSLQVYGRGAQACNKCGAKLQELRLGQRSTVFCPVCQS
jgi:formamidopyrimidine-DNA glycosylase